MNAPGYAARAAAGAAFLDEQLPGWAERINLDTLALYSSYDCVLAQLGENYYHVRDDLLLGMTGAALLGFTLPMDTAEESESGWDALDAAWLAEIKTRRETAEVIS